MQSCLEVRHDIGIAYLLADVRNDGGALVAREFGPAYASIHERESRLAACATRDLWREQLPHSRRHTTREKRANAHFAQQVDGRPVSTTDGLVAPQVIHCRRGQEPRIVHVEGDEN